MNIYTLYFSPTGGTTKVLDILTSAWDCEKNILIYLKVIFILKKIYFF